MISTITLPPDIQSQHLWFLRMQANGAESDIDSFKTLFRNFAVLGGAGAFLAHNSDGRNHSMEIVAEKHVASDAIEFHVNVAFCDLRYARLLRNAVFSLGEVLGNPVIEFRVEPVNSGQADIRIEAVVEPSEVMAGSFYPELSTILGVHIQKTVPPNYRSGRRMWISCVNELSIEFLKDAVDLVQTWASALEFSYPSSEQELKNGESMILNVEGSQHDEITFEVLVDKFIASEAALFSLMNLLIIRANRENSVSIAVIE